jgi:molecular chaperone DnaK (HSP70)
VLVADFGGGTLDIALLRLQGNMFLTQALAGTLLYFRDFLY